MFNSKFLLFCAESRFKLPKGSKYEEELKTIYEELNPIEKYALNFLEVTAEEMNDLELKMAEVGLAS